MSEPTPDPSPDADRPFIGTPPNVRSAAVVLSLLVLGAGLSYWAITGGPAVGGGGTARAQATPVVDVPPPSPEVLQRGWTLQQHSCVGCHAVEGRMAGPSYAEIVRQYRTDPDPRAGIAAAVLHPSPGFANYPPGPNESHLSEADRLALADWMLSLKTSAH